MKNWMKYSLKKVKLNHIESYKPRERYQSNIVFFKLCWGACKYILTIMDHFTK